MNTIKKIVFCYGVLLLLWILFPWKESFAAENLQSDALRWLPQDPLYKKQWSLFNEGSEDIHSRGIDIDIKESWRKINRKREVIVAVIDTGVDIFHEDLKNIFWTNKGEIPDNGIDDDKNGFIDDIHGWNFFDNNNILYQNEYDKHSTHITGIIAANYNDLGIVGIASGANVKIMVLKVLGGKEEGGYTYAIGNAIRYAERNGALICNLSFGTVKKDRHLMDSIQNSGMLFITAAGNGEKGKMGFDLKSKPIYPASLGYDNIISVANLMENGELNPSSNYSSTTVHLAAPGTNILSTLDWKTYKKGFFEEPYGFMSGTSMAVPMVTGVAANLLSSYPEISIAEVREGILGRVKKTPNLSKKVVTSGMLSMRGAISYIESVILPRKEVITMNVTQKKDMKAEHLDKGNSPQIFLKKSKSGKYFFVFKDMDNDISEIRYTEGHKTKKFFQKGSLGNKVSISNKRIGFTLKKSKTYTIYVIDKKENETIKVVRVK